MTAGTRFSLTVISQDPPFSSISSEGGSYDFIVEAEGKIYVIRPSFSYIEGQLDGITADYLFLGIAGIAKADSETENKFFEETVEKVKPSLVIPLHRDNFFSPLDQPVKAMPGTSIEL